MATRGWESIEEKKVRLLEKVTENLSEEKFRILEATLKVEAKYRHHSRVPRQTIRGELMDAVERNVT